MDAFAEQAGLDGVAPLVGVDEAVADAAAVVAFTVPVDGLKLGGGILGARSRGAEGGAGGAAVGLVPDPAAGREWLTPSMTTNSSSGLVVMLGSVQAA
ncbi:hypothetical protein ACFVX9_30555 [Kitasatospora sp. NPDC058243]|uniref:hypothetical protein n=1 Tax=Kitasatospora sp. NPDC058243 TaxID=3346397 RepID=UPI0036D8E3E4